MCQKEVAEGESTTGPLIARRNVMPTITTQDGVGIFYQDCGTGRPVVLSHGWPLSSEAWELELKLLPTTATARLPTPGAATAARREPIPATTWTTTQPIWPPSWRHW